MLAPPFVSEVTVTDPSWDGDEVFDGRERFVEMAKQLLPVLVMHRSPESLGARFDARWRIKICSTATTSDITVTISLEWSIFPDRPAGPTSISGSHCITARRSSTDMRRTDPRWQPGNYETNLEATRRLIELAASKDATVAQLALAWLLAQGEHIVPIPGTRSPQRLEENIRATELTFTKADLEAIDSILPTGGFGARYAGDMTPVWN